MAEAPAPGGSTRPETKVALGLLGVGAALALAHVGWRFGGLSNESAKGALVDVFGVSGVAAVLWAMLSIRALAADGSVAQALDDGLTATAAATWMAALAPPRASNYLLEGATSDFAYAYLPAGLVAVLLMNAAVALWPQRRPVLVAVRLFATAAPGLVVLGVLLWLVGGGEGALVAAVRAWAAGAVAAGMTLGLWLGSRRS